MADHVRNLIEETKEEYSLTSEQIVLGGFSQGGGLALYTGLTHAEKLGGIIALSTWLPMRDYVVKRLNEVNYTGDILIIVKCRIGYFLSAICTVCLHWAHQIRPNPDVLYLKCLLYY